MHLLCIDNDDQQFDNVIAYTVVNICIPNILKPIRNHNVNDLSCKVKISICLYRKVKYFEPLKIVL